VVQMYFRSQRDRSAQPHINSQQLGSTLIPLPPVEEQRKIAGGLAAVDKEVEAEEKRRVALRALFKSMLHHLMTGKIRVNAL
jgi:type I restriction enzyme S subunit